jgi:DNA-directed RNA polymerase subunit RPC12/RpoP
MPMSGKVRCPWCEKIFDFPADRRDKDTIECPSCFTKLEIKQTSLVQVKIAGEKDDFM